MILAKQPFTDVVFMYEGIDWLKWLVAFFFFVLGFFGGWWKWCYRRQRVGWKRATASENEPKPSLSFKQEKSESQGSELGAVYDSEPEKIDDLQRIRGIGKALRAKLYSMGIYQFEQIAAWGEAEVAAVSKKLQLVEQITKNEWVEQAKSLQMGSDSNEFRKKTVIT